MNGLQYSNAITGSQVEHFHSVFLFACLQVLDGQGMGVCNVADMNEIAHTTAIPCWIVITKYRQLRKFANGCLCNGRYQVLGFAYGKFADQCRWMSAYG